MKLSDLRIGTQLRLGFGIILFLIIISGALSWIQNEKLATQTRELYEHPLQVQRAVGALRADVFGIHGNMKDLFLVSDEQKLASVIQEIKLFEDDAFKQFDIIYELYLGEIKDIDTAYNYFVAWNTMRDETIRLVQDGQIDKAALRTTTGISVEGIQAEMVLEEVNEINRFAQNMADIFFNTAMDNKRGVEITYSVFLFLFIIVSLIIISILIQNIKNPLKELSLATLKFKQGGTNIRSNYKSLNEFGVLSDGFNEMAQVIEKEKELTTRTAEIREVMLGEENAIKFCHDILLSLLNHTDSQMGAVYLLNDEKTSFEQFVCLGMNKEACSPFSAQEFEGEFGKVLASKKIQIIKKIPEDTRFIFSAVSGKIKPKEIVTIPIESGEEIIAIISIGNIKKFRSRNLKLIETVLPTLNARMVNVFANSKIIEFSEKLEIKNQELDAQKRELSSQANELMEQNTELEYQKKQLDEASRLKTNFLSNMSHELRTPLNSVIALSGVLNRRLNKKIPEEEFSYLEVIERNGKHLLSLINNILDISRIEAGREEIEISTFNINELISELVTMIKPQADQKKIKLTHINNKVNFPITSDREKCMHILQNIISNAVKFTEKGGVTINASKYEEQLVIDVTDTGIGIEQKNLVNIFDEFKQADGSTSRKFGGTGLGLAISKKLSNLLGGYVSIKSEPGKGSEFKITLPINFSLKNHIIEEVDAFNKTNLIEHSEFSTTKHLNTSLKTVLLVDDSEPAIIQLKDILDEIGYNILIARDGKEALDLIQKTPPDAIILDLMMPEIDGFEVLKTVRDNEKTLHIPILILTAKHITKDELKFLKKNNIRQLIQKGDVNRMDLLNAVSSMIYGPQKEATKAKPGLTPKNQKQTVLIVEDNADNMVTVKAVLGDNFKILEAVNGLEGVSMAKKHVPDLILMDIALPEMDGIEALKTIRLDGRLHHVPVIAITASAMITDREVILAHGFDAYIAKPIDNKEFFNTINKTLYGK